MKETSVRQLLWMCLVLFGCAHSTSALESPSTVDTLALRLAEVYRDHDDYSAAARLLRERISAPGATGQSRLRLEVKLAQVHVDRVFDGTGDAAAARTLLQRLTEETRASDEHGLWATAIDALGMVEYSETLWRGSGSYETARTLFLKALPAREALGDRSAIAETAFHVGLTYEQEGEGTQAEKFYRRALAEAEAANDRVQLAYALRHLAGYRERAGELDEALAMLRRSLTLRVATGWVRGVSYALLAVADVQSAKGDPAAESTYVQALDLAGEMQQERVLLWTSFGLGLHFERSGQLEPSLQHLRRAKEIAQSGGIERFVPLIEENLARVRKKTRDTRK
jgi:tetratricopeptide (TPR) repeat protein